MKREEDELRWGNQQPLAARHVLLRQNGAPLMMSHPNKGKQEEIGDIDKQILF